MRHADDSVVLVAAVVLPDGAAARSRRNPVGVGRSVQCRRVALSHPIVARCISSGRSPASPPLLTRHRVNRMARPRFCRSVRPNLKRFRNRPQSIPRYFLQKKRRPPLSSKDLPVNSTLRSLHLPLLPRAPSPWLPETKGRASLEHRYVLTPPLIRATRALYPLSEKGYLIYLI